MNIASKIICLMVAIQATNHEPLLYPESLEARRDLTAQPALADGAARHYWYQASAEAYIPLFRAYINERVALNGFLEDTQAQRWWKRTLEEDPAALASAICEADSHTTVWCVESWPDSLEPLLPLYRLSLVEAVFEAYQANSAKANEIRAEISEYKPLNLLPPEGLPAHADPAMVKDPGLRADYQQRLEEMQRRQMVESELRRTRNAFGQLDRAWSAEMRLLYAGANEHELLDLAQLLVDQGWADTELCREIVAGWPALAQAMNDLP